MCHVPSWITTDKKEILFLTDKDVRKHGLSLYDATGHSGIRSVFPDCDGEEHEGLHKNTPKVIREAFAAGKFNKLASVGDIAILGGTWELPMTEIGGELTIEKRAKVTAPRLKSVCSILSIATGSRLDAPVLKGADYLEGNGKLVAPKFKHS